MKVALTILFAILSFPLFAFQSIVVLPFSNEAHEQSLYWLGEGFAESLSEEVFMKDAYFIQRAERKNAYDDLKLPYIGDLSRATMLKIGQKLSADYIVFGSFNLKDSTLEVRARVIQLSSSKLSDSINAYGSLDSLFTIQTNLKQQLTSYFQAQKLVALQQVSESKPVPLHAYELYIKGLLEANDADRIGFYQKAIEANPGYEQAAYRLGLTLSRMQRYKESTDVFQKATFTGVLRPKVDFQVALNAYNQKDYDNAYQQWLTLSQTQSTPEVLNNIGAALLKKGEIQGCGWYFSKSGEIDKTNPDYHFNLAGSYVLRSYDKNAVDQYRQAIHDDPTDFQSLYLLAKLLEREGTAASAKVMQSFQDVLPPDQKGKFPEQYTTVVQIVRTAPELLSSEEKQYMVIARNNRTQARANYVKTYSANALKDLQEAAPDKALLELRKAAGLDPLNYYVHYLWGWTLNVQKDVNGAIAELEFSIWCQDNVESHLMLADIYRSAEKFADAKTQVQRILALEPNNKKAQEIWNKIWDKQ